ncbi:hypothetical protein PROFUN_09022 [Planoprotostelium fungivorum]|uniref:Guanylate cyclase domain-containing protein n=1 Tax=Planoprotostelium fungivorum TaxID=1890364 RepID=A0A2P6MV64_9EUKA|nr:hypothetical protein PROFUN_09022 [Planoprotostelium fungivorum]
MEMRGPENAFGTTHKKSAQDIEAEAVVMGEEASRVVVLKQPFELRSIRTSWRRASQPSTGRMEKIHSPKCFGAESYHGQMDVWENIVYNSTDTPLYGWYINATDDISQILNRSGDFEYQFSATANLAGGHGGNCSSPRWWVDIHTYTAYDPPIMIIGQNAVFCRGDTLIGYMKSCVEVRGIQESLQKAFAVGQDASLYLIDSKGRIVATSTGDEQITVSTTNLTWISESYSRYNQTSQNIFSLQIDGTHYVVYVKNNITADPQLNWSVFILMAKPVDNFVRNVILTGFFTCIAAALLVFITTFLITRSLFHLSNELEKVSRLELDLNHLSEPPIWEAQKLYKSFIMMHAALSSFRKFVPIELISHIMKSRREAFPYLNPSQATIYFQDIKDFTKLAEVEQPEVLAAITEEYMEAMTSIIIDHGGMIDKYIGDCIMALFNLPKPQNGHEQSATRAALECTEQLQLLNKRWKRLYNIELQHRIGINTGEVLAGNVGSSQRLAYTCIGDNVNLASRVEGANKFYGTTILVTDSTFEKINQETFQTRKMSTVRVAGKKRETVLYEISGNRSPEYRDLCQNYERVLQLYDDRKLHEAYKEMEDLDQFGNDMATQRLKDRITAALHGEASWSIIEVLDKC